MSSEKKRKRLKGTETEKIVIRNKKWPEAIAASDKGSYSEQDKLLELDGFGQRRRRSGFRFQCQPFEHLSYIPNYYSTNCNTIQIWS